MKNKKDIFDLFRDNEHKLDERPDDKLWDRLEGRLDQSSEPHIAPSRNGWRQWMSMAGVMLALIVAISVANMMLRGGNADRQSAENAARFTSLEMEEIGIFSDKGPNYTVGEYQKILARLNTSPILEGDANKKILVKHNTYNEINKRSRRQIAQLDKTSKAKDVEKKREAKFKDDKRLEEANMKSSFADEQTSGSTAYSYDANGKEFVTKTDSEEEESADFSYSEYADAAEVEDADVVLSAPATTMSSTEAIENAGELDAISNSVTYSSADVAGIQQFEWMLGRWEAPGSNLDQEQVVTTSSSRAKKRLKNKRSSAAKEMNKDMIQSNRSVEEWRPLNEFTIEGQGYLVVNGDTTFTESMQIKKIDNDLYYILALDNSGKTVQYKLKTYTEAGAIFENEAVAFPNQVILQRDFSNSNFTTLLQNKIPAQINSEQQEYFQNRNMIQSEQIKRVMNRVEN